MIAEIAVGFLDERDRAIKRRPEFPALRASIEDIIGAEQRGRAS